MNYTWTHQLQFDGRIKLDKFMEELERKVAMVGNFKESFIKITDNKSSAVLYPNSTSSSATPIMAKARLLNTYT